MGLLSMPATAMAGIAFYMGFYHLLVFIRRRTLRNSLMLALLSFSIGMYCVFCAGLYSANSVADGVRWQRLQVIALAGVSAAALWFIAEYTSFRPAAILYPLTIYFALAALAQLVFPGPLTWIVDPPSIKQIVLPWGLHFTYYEATPGLLTNLQSVVGMATAIYIVVCVVRFYRLGGHGARSLLLAFGMLTLSAFNDTAVSSGLYRFIYTIEYGYLFVVVVMTDALSRDVLEAVMVKEALRQRQRELESLLEISSDLLSELDLSQLLKLIAQHAVVLLAADEAVIFRLEDDGSTLRPILVHASYAEPMLAFSIQVGQGITGAAVAERRPILANYALQDPRAVTVPGTPLDENEHVMAVPLIFRDRIIGAMLVNRISREPFVPENLDLFVGIAQQAGIAIMNARLYEESQRHAAELARRVAERTAELQEANSHLEALSRVKDDFVANVSHELRTPVANIKLYLHLLSLRPEKAELYVQTIHRETLRLEHLVESLLTLSRLDRGMENPHLEMADLNELIGALVADREPLAADHGLVLTFGPASALPHVQVDPMLIGQVVSILLTNAFDYTPQGGRVVVETVARESTDGRWVGVRVSDTGPGIKPAEAEHIFERFYRGEAGRASGKPGTGLGLSIATEIVRLHQGLIEVASEGVVGQGATFTVWLPAA